jgi:hypothetical protein
MEDILNTPGRSGSVGGGTSVSGTSSKATKKPDKKSEPIHITMDLGNERFNKELTSLI